MNVMYALLDKLMTDMGMSVGPEDLTLVQANNLHETLEVGIDALKEEVQLADAKQLAESTLPQIMAYCQGIIELEDLRRVLEEIALAEPMPGHMDPPEPMDVQKFMCDYALYCGHISTGVKDPMELTPRAYMEQFVSSAWLPTRDEMYAFLVQFAPDKEEVYVWIDETFEWR